MYLKGKSGWGKSMTSHVKRLLLKTLRAVEAEVRESERKAPRASRSRAGKKLIAGHFAPEASWQLKKLALDRGTTVQSLLEEGIADLFEKYHLPRL